MQLSVATANLYLEPFEQVLEIIGEAGFQNIELDLYWTRKEWAVAQHLKDVPVKRVIQLIQRSGLRVSSIHDAGGVLEEADSVTGFINPALDEYLNELGYAPDCLVFHTPHIEGDPGAGWWGRISDQVARSLEKYRGSCACLCIENMPTFEGYSVPLRTPAELHEFVAANGLQVTLDTTHYAQIGIDIAAAARELGKAIKTIHLSDFKAGRSHVFPGEGELDLAGFFEVIDKDSLQAVTLESSLASLHEPVHEMSHSELIGRLRAARLWLERLL